MLKHLLLAAALLAGLTFHSISAAEPAHIVFMIGEDEYHTWETLPDFAEKQLKPHGYKTEIISADAGDKNSFPGIEAALKNADLLFLSVRRRTPPQEQLDAVRAYLAAGKPLVGVRTACHAFALRPTDPPAAPPLSTWQDFDPEVLGGHYTNHYEAGPPTLVTAAPRAGKHRILQGISVKRLVGAGSLYK